MERSRQPGSTSPSGALLEIRTPSQRPGVRPSRSLAQVLLSTSWEEVVGFVSLYQIPQLALVVFILAAVYLLLALRLPHMPLFSGRPGALGMTGSRALLLATPPVTVYVASNPADLMDGIAINPVTGSVMFFAADVPRAYASWKGTQVQKIPYGARRSGGEEVHILVIGESARRDSWSVYGYGRSTTPYLDKLKDEVIFLQDAVADANLTSWSVPIILTGITPEQFATAPVRGTLVDLAREAGYSTAWLVNQDISMTKYAGIHADHMTHPPPVTNIFDLKTLDGVSIPAQRSRLRWRAAPFFKAGAKDNRLTGVTVPCPPTEPAMAASSAGHVLLLHVAARCRRMASGPSRTLLLT